MRRWMAVVSLCVPCLCATIAFAQQPQDEAAQANALWNAGKHIEALPLYEQLAKAHPENWVYQERLAAGLGDQPQPAGGSQGNR